MDDYYTLLGVQRFTSSQDEIRSAYREQIMFFHPDKGNVNEQIALQKTQELNNAYNTLKDPELKAEYDAKLKIFLEMESLSHNDRVNRCYEVFKSQVPNYKYDQFSNNGGKSEYDNYSSYYNPSRGGNGPVSETKSKNKSGKGTLGCLIWILFIVLIFHGLADVSRNPTNSSETSTPNPSTSTYSPVEVYNGKVFKQPTGDCPCQFTVETREGSNFYIYMKDVNGKNDLSFYVVGGKTVTKKIPLGTYQLYYCSGETWYGLTHKFGDTTVASKSDDLFTFSSSTSGNYIYYDSWTVTLYRVQNGNLSTERIDMLDFPD